MNTFISYSTEDKEIAGTIKRNLDQYDFNCFLAHDDIPFQSKWPKKIIDNLKTCNLFLPLLTENFNKSYYCQQEIGFAFCRDIDILPIMITKKPIGMIDDIQSLRFNEKDIDCSCWKIVKHLAKNKTHSKSVLNAIIKWFGESPEYRIANHRADLILNEFEFTECQVKMIIDYIKSNSQIHETKDARESIFKFFDKYNSYISKEFREWYDSNKASRKYLNY
jgi:hypothetical protein